MQRKFGIKRSFHCEDLSSIINLDQHAAQHVEGDHTVQKRTKRQRAISMDSSPCSAVCYCCAEDEAAKFMPSATSVDSFTQQVADAAPSSTSTSAVRLISPATSHVAVGNPASAAVVSPDPELNPSPESQHGLSSLPNFPSLKKSRNETSCSDFPATAALERFMLKQRRSPGPEDSNSDGGEFSPSFEDDGDDNAFDFWTKSSEQEQEDLNSPRHVSGFPWCNTRRVSMASRKSSSASVKETNDHSSVPPFTCLSGTSACKLQSSRSKTRFSRRPITTVNQLTEALARI